MKQLFIYAAVLCSFLASCQNKKKDKEEKNKNISSRDLSITKTNAYSDLFLDSSALENFMAEKELSDSITRRMRSFYNTRNYQYAWFASDGLAEQARAFWNIHDYYTTYVDDSSFKDKALQERMDNLITEEQLTVQASDKAFLNTELTLTQHFIQYSLKAFERGYVKRKELERFIPRKKENAMYLADSLLHKKHKDNKYFEDIHEFYGALKEQLKLYYNIAKKGGWPIIQSTQKSYKKGISSLEITAIKQRLFLSGDMPAQQDASPIFTDTLEVAVKNFQERHGYKPDGIITAALIKEMNVPIQKRMQQLLINMDRMRWMPAQPKGNIILVNIPEFVLYVMDGNNKVFDMAVVVGKEGHNTMMFTGDLNQMVFSPYWNIPFSIVKNEILPVMNRNSGYLASQNMEVIDNAGELPRIRQKPGSNNALGKVKFLFPNSFNIYFHDTPSKSLFGRDKRAFSHGCIRLSDPEKMAIWLLRDQPEWPSEKIKAAMNSGNEQYVKLKDPVPVFITYYTAWVDAKGRLNFREDIYGHDDKFIKKAFL